MHCRKLLGLLSELHLCLSSLCCRQDNVCDSCSVFMQPVMLFNPGKISSTSRLLFERGIAMVVVGFPATPLLSARARICISASHSREDLDWALQVTPPLLPSCPAKYLCWVAAQFGLFSVHQHSHSNVQTAKSVTFPQVVFNLPYTKQP